MILASEPKVQKQLWQTQLIEGFRTPAELLTELGLPHTTLFSSELAHREFPTRVPRGFVDRMEKNNPNDPLLKQVLPLGIELIKKENFTLHPLAESEFNPMPGLLHKYHGRVLVILSGACAVNCRYCFRRHFPYSENKVTPASWEKIFAYLREDLSIEEVILSGGDPLVIADSVLKDFVQRLESIEHVKFLRFHTRLPIVLPDRITEDFISILSTSRLQSVVVTHSNHANEINESVAGAIAKMKSSGITLFNQAVLLKGINDSQEALINLSKKLFSVGIIPYYLHQLDLVQGASHFKVSVKKAKNLIKQVRHSLPGYLVPKLVVEQPGAKAKTPLA